MDLFYLAGIVLFLGLCMALASGCEQLRRHPPGGRP
ncbi:potassium ABC transporter ATPase [Caballeronia sp. LZ065]|nr:potassium ABC transporter ATPase [Caballeronia sp. LZ065]MDR5779023.1 potassium ABC transporter ATPase [Caballeronia sp. LZ065]